MLNIPLQSSKFDLILNTAMFLTGLESFISTPNLPFQVQTDPGLRISRFCPSVRDEGFNAFTQAITEQFPEVFCGGC